MESPVLPFTKGGWNLLPEDSISPGSFHPPTGDGNLLLNRRICQKQLSALNE